ncbi:hypothetical protein CV093_13795 [Oceanobacillus sp. 143]|jgi:hypothetical protein|uniref:hypothetical protein n=1 Tax=Oceanobacillus zhaokaii TaxID=2052660 RepID=UPI001317E192|nr:hypothetical protein [Oceanobacillus zhaokaii]QGS69067.1 hypothetical protein CV093_13795 [Oceanobacillus sp. 143]
MDRDIKKTNSKPTDTTGFEQEFSEEFVDIYEKEASIRSKNPERYGRGINSTPTMRNG